MDRFDAPLDGERRRPRVPGGAGMRGRAGWRDEGLPQRSEVRFAPEDVSCFLHYIFYIPIQRGITQAWVDDYAPGWLFDDLLRALWDADAVVPYDRHVSGLRPVDGLRWVRIGPDGRRLGIQVEPNPSEAVGSE